MRSASSITRDSSRDNDNILDCKRVSARDGVAITMSGLSESKILERNGLFFECKKKKKKFTVADVRLYQMQYLK